MNLKRCPFCGGIAQVNKAEHDILAARVHCTNCYAEIFIFDNSKQDKRLSCKNLKDANKRIAQNLNRRLQRRWNKRVDID